MKGDNMAHDDPLKRTSKDYLDPFRYEGTNFRPPKSNGVHIPFEIIEPRDMIVIRRLGEQLSRMLVTLRDSGLQIMPPHPAVASADLAVVHLRRGLDLEAFSRASPEDQLQEYCNIARQIDRQLGEFPSLAPLRFARKTL